MQDHWVTMSPSHALTLAQLQPHGGAVTSAPAAPTMTIGAPATAVAPAPAAPEVAVTQTGTTTAPGSVDTTLPAKPSSPFSSIIQFAPIALMLVVLYFVMIRGQKKTEKTRKTMVANMKKGDEVMTIGGLVARVVSVDADEVVLKIDESANVKARYKKSAIQQVLTGDEKTK